MFMIMSRLLSKEELSQYSDCSESNKKVGNLINPNSKIKVSKYVQNFMSIEWGSSSRSHLSISILVTAIRLDIRYGIKLTLIDLHTHRHSLLQESHLIEHEHKQAYF